MYIFTWVTIIYCRLLSAPAFACVRSQCAVPNVMLCCKKVPESEEDHEVVPAGPINVRVLFEMPWDARNWPGDSALALLVKNETQGKTFKTECVKSERWGYHDRAYMNDYEPNDELSVYIYLQEKGGIEEGYAEKIDIPIEQFQEALTPELMGANAKKRDVMVVCTVKIRWSAEWMKEISTFAQLIDKGAKLDVPARPCWRIDVSYSNMWTKYNLILLRFWKRTRTWSIISIQVFYVNHSVNIQGGDMLSCVHYAYVSIYVLCLSIETNLGIWVIMVHLNELGLWRFGAKVAERNSGVINPAWSTHLCSNLFLLKHVPFFVCRSISVFVLSWSICFLLFFPPRLPRLMDGGSRPNVIPCNKQGALSFELLHENLPCVVNPIGHCGQKTSFVGVQRSKYGDMIWSFAFTCMKLITTSHRDVTGMNGIGFGESSHMALFQDYFMYPITRVLQRLLQASYKHWEKAGYIRSWTGRAKDWKWWSAGVRLWHYVIIFVQNVFTHVWSWNTKSLTSTQYMKKSWLHNVSSIIRI